MATDGPTAAFTIVQNEPVWLPVWFDYYARQFGPKNVYVLDHDSAEGRVVLGQIKAAGGCVVPVHRAYSFDHTWLRDTVEKFQAFLLQSHPTVVFAEADEFLLSTHPGGLAGFLAGRFDPCIRARGFDVVHYRGEEPGMDFRRRPLLAQRRWWRPSQLYSKTLVARRPLAYSAGFHAVYTVDGLPAGLQTPDPALFLAHMHRADFDTALDRHRDAAARTWHPSDLRTGAGYQNRITDEAQLAEWFYRDVPSEGPREPIPDDLKAAF